MCSHNGRRLDRLTEQKITRDGRIRRAEAANDRRRRTPGPCYLPSARRRAQTIGVCSGIITHIGGEGTGSLAEGLSMGVVLPIVL